MLFARYKEVTDRCLELGAKMDVITNKEGVELRRLLEEQAWLSKTIARQVKGILEELRQGLGCIQDWIAEAFSKVERALDEKGIPSDILALEEVMAQGSALREQVRGLMLESETSEQVIGSDENTRQQEICPRAAEIRIDLLTDGESEDIKTLTPREEIDAGVKQVAVSAVEPDICGVIEPQQVEFQRDNSQPVEAMTYKVSDEIITRLENKLSPKLLVTEFSKAGPLDEREFTSKKAGNKKAKKRKKK